MDGTHDQVCRPALAFWPRRLAMRILSKSRVVNSAGFRCKEKECNFDA